MKRPAVPVFPACDNWCDPARSIGWPMSRDALDLFNDQRSEVALMESWLNSRCPAGETLRILEAGCGRRWPFDLGSRPHHIVGIDLDEAALAIRMSQRGDLYQAIVGDLCTHRLPEGEFHVVYCSFVLEHIIRSEQALRNLVAATRSDGVLLIRVPDQHSVQGFVTRLTPQWFHVLYYRWILGNPNAGKPGMGPYPTHYTRLISRRGMSEYCSDPANGVVLDAVYGDGYTRPGKGIRRRLISLVKITIHLISLGSLSHRHTDLLFVLRKTDPSRPTAGGIS